MTKTLAIGRISRYGGQGMRIVVGSHTARGTGILPANLGSQAGIGSVNCGLKTIRFVACTPLPTDLTKGSFITIAGKATATNYFQFRRMWHGTTDPDSATRFTKGAIPFQWMAIGE